MKNWLRQKLRRFLGLQNVHGSAVSVRGAPIAPVHGGPTVSFIVIVYDMPRQAANTVRSLLPEYQQGVTPEAYEVIIVENRSKNPMEQSFLDSLPSNCCYFLRDETEPTPIHAINFGIEKARGQHVCVMIDGARLLTPGVVRNTILAHRVSERAIVTVPGYHLGHKPQQQAVETGYNEEREMEMMDDIGWPRDGYRLFDIACFSVSSAAGFYMPHSESNCISMPREIWADLGGYDPNFDTRGGGMVNLDLYKRACEYPETVHIVLQGEGTFHQFHGGVTTGGEDTDDRPAFMQEIKQQYKDLRGEWFSQPHTDPIYFGELSEPVQRFVFHSSASKLHNQGRISDIPVVPAEQNHI